MPTNSVTRITCQCVYHSCQTSSASCPLTLACRSSELPVPRYSCRRRGSTLACATALACSGVWRPICPSAQAAAACVYVGECVWLCVCVCMCVCVSACVCEGVVVWRGSAIITDSTATVAVCSKGPPPPSSSPVCGPRSPQTV